MTREEHRDRIKELMFELNKCMYMSAIDGYKILVDTQSVELTSGGSYDVLTASIMENV